MGPLLPLYESAGNLLLLLRGVLMMGLPAAQQQGREHESLMLTVTTDMN